MTDFR
jgi:hypothetical protein